MGDGGGAYKCFISYARADQAWAEWAAWQLQDAGHDVWLDVWSLSPGADWAVEIPAAVWDFPQMLVLVSTAYVQSRMAGLEVETAAAAGARLIPALVDDSPIPGHIGPLRERQYVSLDGLDDRAAREALLRAVAPGLEPVGGRLRRLGATSPRLPGSLPRVWNVPERSDRFVGRGDLLRRLRSALTERSRAVLVGAPGMGKTQLAIEYAHRFAGEYECVWWIRSGRGSVGSQLAELAARTGAAVPDARPADAISALAAELRTRNRWLLVLDDVTDPDVLPNELGRDPGNGQVLLISRDSGWAGFADALEVGPLTPEESSAMLRTLVPTLSESDAEEMAADLRAVPLAMVQAAGIIDGGMPVASYRWALSAEAPAEDPPHVLEHTVRFSLARLREEQPGAAVLLSACSLLAPQSFRIRDHARVLPDWTPPTLAAVLRNINARESALGAASRYSLAQAADGVVRIHPAVHSALREQLSPKDRATAALGAQALLLSALPPLGAPSEAWASLLPHLLAVAPQDLTRSEGLVAACQGCVRLLEDGDAATAVSRLTELREASAALLGTDAAVTMEMTSYLIAGLRATGDPAAARPLAEALLDSERRALGDDHPAALETAAQLAELLADSGDHEEALEVGEATRSRLRGVLGPDHPRALNLSAALLASLQAVGRTEEARLLGEDTLSRQRRVLGPEHPDALRTAARLAVLFADLGNLDQAMNLREDIHFRLSRSLGPDDPLTLRAAASVAALLIRLDNHAAARSLVHQTLGRQLNVLGTDHIDTLRTAGLLVAVYIGLHDYDDALRWARRAHDRLQRALGPDDAEAQDAALLLVVCLRNTNRWEQAGRVLHESFPDAPPDFTVDDVVARIIDRRLHTASDVPEPDRRTGLPRPFETLSRGPRTHWQDGSSVLVSHVEADRQWADWIGFVLTELGYDVTVEAEDTYLGRPLSRESDIVLALLSPAYLESMAAMSWTPGEWAELTRGDARGRRRFVPLVVEPVDARRLPRALRDTVTPALYDLDPDAARDLLKFTLDEPARPNSAPAFPGATGPDDGGQALLTRRLVNALERSATLQPSDGRRAWLDLLDIPNRSSEGAVSLRTTLYEVVRTLRSRPGGLTDLVEALALLEPDSLAVAEARHVVAEIERGQAAR